MNETVWTLEGAIHSAAASLQLCLLALVHRVQRAVK